MVAEANLTALVFLKPILAFLVVFLILAALLVKSKLFGENLFVPIVVSFALATIFVASGSIKDLVVNVIPWFAVLLIALFMIIFLVGMLGKGGDGIIGKGLGWAFVVLMLLVFVFVGIKVFANTPEIYASLGWLLSPNVSGTIVFAVVAIGAMIFLVKGK